MPQWAEECYQGCKMVDLPGFPSVRSTRRMWPNMETAVRSTARMWSRTSARPLASAAGSGIPMAGTRRTPRRSRTGRTAETLLIQESQA